MTKRNKRLLPLFLLAYTVFAIRFLSPMRFGISPSSTVTVESGVKFKSSETGGIINCTDDFTTTKIYWSGNFLMFDNFNAGSLWSVLGVSCPSGSVVELNEITSSQLQLNVNTSSTATIKIYSAKGSPSSVSGVESWSYSDKKTILNIDGDNSVILLWSAPVPTTISNLISQYLRLGDWSGYIIANYTESLGLGFFVLIFLIPIIGVYMKAGIIPAILTVVILWGVIQAVIPAAGLQLGVIFLSVGVGLYIAYMLMSRRD